MTATLDDAAQEKFNALRRRYFPPDRNVLAAHLTLFHALPGEHADRIVEAVNAVLPTAPLPATAGGLRFLGAGTAYAIDCAPLNILRDSFAASWRAWLTPQDRQGFRPHVTVQNKAAPAAARDVFDRLRSEFAPWHFDLVGLRLWRYEGGPWSALRAFSFTLPGRADTHEFRGIGSIKPA